MKRFKVCFECREDRLTTIITVLSAEVQNLNIQPAEPAKGNHNFSPPPIRRSKISQTRSGQVIMEILKDKEPKTLQQLTEGFVKEGYQATGTAATLSGLSSEGLVIKEGPRYQRTYRLK